MKKLLKKAIVKGYKWMQQHYFTFRILVCLKEHGITRKVNNWVMHSESQVRPEAEMQKSKAFFSENAERAEKMLSLLADERSRIVWGGVIRYRIQGTTLAPDMYSENDQYFVEDVIKISDGEVFIDGGGYTGDTVQQFIDTAKREGKKFKRIIVFEPDERNCSLINKFYGKRQDIKIIPKGLADEEKMLWFKGAGAVFKAADSNNRENAICVPVTNIDAVPECADATWIKMDIEGSEMDALEGARKVITKNHPKLTISIYHSDEDMIRIAEYIHEMVPEYKLYVRHHSQSQRETVLYAVL